MEGEKGLTPTNHPVVLELFCSWACRLIPREKNTGEKNTIAKSAILLFFVVFVFIMGFASLPSNGFGFHKNKTSYCKRFSQKAKSALATSEVLFLGDQQKSIALGKQFLFLQDDTKNLTINNILSHKLDALFQQGTRDVIAVGYVDADFWFKSPVLTNLSENPHWYITINGYATDTLKSASFYYVIEDKVIAYRIYHRHCFLSA